MTQSVSSHSFINNMHYTNKITPNRKSDSKKAFFAKCALIILSLGSAIAITMAIDCYRFYIHASYGKPWPNTNIDDSDSSDADLEEFKP